MSCSSIQRATHHVLQLYPTGYALSVSDKQRVPMEYNVLTNQSSPLDTNVLLTADQLDILRIIGCHYKSVGPADGLHWCVLSGLDEYRQCILLIQ